MFLGYFGFSGFGFGFLSFDWCGLFLTVYLGFLGFGFWVFGFECFVD